MTESLSSANLPHAVDMAYLLWPFVGKEELTKDFTDLLHNDDWTIFLDKTEDEQYAAFMLLSIRRDYVEGSETKPVAYIEGIFVKDNYRQQGIARQLIEAAETWAKEKGCTEMGSDAELHNENSIAFHNRVGFKETNRVVCFIKKLG